MINFFRKPNEKIFNLSKLGKDELIYRVLPRLFMEILKKYFRLEIVGLENIPAHGKVLITPNHSGFSGFDALVLSYVLQQHTKRTPRVLTHHLWFLTETTALPAHKMGFIEANYENGIKELKKNHMVVLFPEGEHGNFKETRKKYQLQEFKRGFIRMALQTQTPIIPTMIFGAEETHINLKKLKFSKYLRGLVLPIPLNILPLPARWKIVFAPPVYLPYSPDQVENRDLCVELASDIQESMQTQINQELKKRGSRIYL